MRRYAVLGRGLAGQRALVLDRDGARLVSGLRQAGARPTVHWPEPEVPASSPAGRRDLLPFREASFDIVLCPALSAQPLPVEPLLAEAARVLRNRGRLVYDAVNATALARLVLGRSHDPARFIGPAEMREMLEAVGLVPGAVMGLGPRALVPPALTAVAYAGVAVADKPGIY